MEEQGAVLQQIELSLQRLTEISNANATASDHGGTDPAGRQHPPAGRIGAPGGTGRCGVTMVGTDAPSVLIIDDSSMMRSLLSRLVDGDRDADGLCRWRLAGTAADGRAAIGQARELRPDICLLDLEMPVLGGLDALPAIRAVCDAAVVVVSSIAGPGSAERRACLMAGAAAVVANPAGPIGARLIEACAALPHQQTLAKGTERDSLVSTLIDGATNRETYFFRDRRQLSLMGTLLRSTAPPGAPLALWSAGCATGEEAYSLAIVLRELGLSAVMTGTDVSRGALATARAALYRTGQMSPCREVGADDETFLPSTPDGRRTVTGPIRAAVRFVEHNILAGPPSPQPQPQFQPESRVSMRWSAAMC